MRHGKAATVAVGSVISPPSGPRARAVSYPMCSDLLQTLRTLASDLLYPALPRSPCSQAPTEPLDPPRRMDEEEDPEGTPGPNSAGAPRARSTINCAAHHACTPPSCTTAPSLYARSPVLAVRVPMIYSCHRRSHRRLSPPYHHHATNTIVTTATTVTTVTASATTVATAIFPTAPLLLPLRTRPAA